MVVEMQIGKNGLTDNVLERIKNAFNNQEIVKIAVLKASGREKDTMQEMNGKILAFLGKKFTSRVIGFTIIIRKWRKERG